MSRGGSLATRLKKEPGAPLGFVDPHLDEAGGGDVAVLVAHVMRLAKARRKVLVVLAQLDRKSTRLNSSHGYNSYAVFCLKKKKRRQTRLKTLLEIDKRSALPLSRQHR